MASLRMLIAVVVMLDASWALGGGDGGGPYDATLALAQVGASKTQYHDAHGALDAAAVGVPGTDPGGRVAFTVHAEF